MTTAGQVRNVFPAWRIFCYGVEVTKDVISCIVNQNDGRAPSTAEFVLANKNDQYTVTQRDLELIYGDIANTDILTDELFEPSAFTPEQVVSVLRARTDEAFAPNSIKGRVLYSKIGVRQPVKQLDVGTQVTTSTLPGSATSTATASTNIRAFSGDAPRYPFTLGSPIFHSNDAIRIFWRDPYNTQRWYHMFSGFLSGHAVSLQANGDNTVTLRCEDVLRIFRYSRIAINPSIFDIAASKTANDTEFQAFFKDGFQGLTLEQIIAILMFGSTATGLDAAVGVSVETGQQTVIQGAALPNYIRNGVNGTTTSPVISNGIGSFNFDDSRVYTFGPTTLPGGQDFVGPVTPDQVGLAGTVAGVRVEQVSSLAQYQSQIDHQVYADDLVTLLGPNADPSVYTGLIQSITPRGVAPGQPGSYPSIPDVISLIGQHPEIWPVDFGRLVMLIPTTLGNGVSTAIIRQDLIDSFANSTKFNTRLAIIYNLCQRIEFSFYATPRGDIVMEMPLYDFDPLDFGTSEIDFTPVRSDADIVPANEKRGPFAQRYTFTNSDIESWNEAFDDEKVRTQFRAAYLNFAGFESLGKQDQTGSPPAVVQIDSLIPLFGVRSEDIDPYGYIGSLAAAQVYAHIKLNQWNSDANTSKVTTIPRIGIGPNRPLKYLMYEFTEAKDAKLRYGFVSTCRAVTHSIVWGSSMSSTITSNYQRRWDGQVASSGRPLYSPLSGYASRPLNYNLIFDAVPSSQTDTTAANTGTTVTTSKTNATNANQPQMSYKSRTAQSFATNHGAQSRISLSDDEKAKRIAFMKAQADIIAVALSAQTGVAFTGSDVLGGNGDHIFRSEDENNALIAQGLAASPNSLHRAALAADLFPSSAMGPINAKLAAFGKSPISIGDGQTIVQNLSNTGAIAPAQELIGPNTANATGHDNHVHYGVALPTYQLFWGSNP